MLHVGWVLYQTLIDRYSDQSGQALRKAEEVLQTSTTACRRLPFSPSLRRKAVNLLDACPRIEGLWHTREAAAVARFVIALEEHVEVEELGEDDLLIAQAHRTSCSISEDRRVHSLRFGQIQMPGSADSTSPLDVKIMTRPEAIMARLCTTKYQIRGDDWADGRGDVSQAIQNRRP
ncbi:unnamed protein product [Zymoseptoria tritici ST99CH_3D1]|uniref:Uncharacterized protein n=1 Tax=Zymoseptoria tritici ST99CH_1E4 TaxID=1276532 RepID=A0A2H1GMY7_ZYMTR|nr:unnamed protein product [Zymoseptoria tritici ST99CH_1E4]SMR57344.1 unnamed protein product [Zymoseptoria tritici ST99CH_3D1]